MTSHGLLGSSDYAVHITTRGGKNVLGEMPWDQISYSRVANDTGDGLASWFTQDVTIPDFLIDAEPWEHDLVIWRTTEPEPVFVGPIRTCTYDEGLVQVAARDVSTWFENRRNHTDATYTNRDLAEIFAAIAEEALAQDPTPNLAIIVAKSGVVGTRVLLASERAQSADLLRELARSGVDWTTVARRMLIGGADLMDGLDTLVLIDDAVTKPRLVKAGDVTTTRQIVRWQSASDQMPRLTTDSALSLHQLGLLESLDEEADIADVASAANASKTRIALLSNNPRSLTATLTADAPASLAQLVPGRKVDWRLSTLPVRVQGVKRLQRLNVTVSQDNESVSVETTPLGATA